MKLAKSSVIGVEDKIPHIPQNVKYVFLINQLYLLVFFDKAVIEKCTKDRPKAVFCVLSAVFIPVGTHLSGKRHDAVVLSPVLHNAAEGRLHICIFNQQTHAAAKLSLDRTGCRCDPVFDIELQKKIPQSQSLLIIRKQNVPADICISHSAFQ